MKQYPLPQMFRRIEKAISSYPQAVMFALRDRGFNSLFEQLVSCIISIRTRDETSMPLSLKLFEKARTPKEVLLFSFEELADLLYGATFPGQKQKPFWPSQKRRQTTTESCRRMQKSSWK